MLAFAATLASCVIASQPGQTPAEPSPALAAFTNPSENRQARVTAAAELIDQIDDSATLAALWQALRDPSQASIVLEAIVRRGSPPRVLWTHVRAAAETPDLTDPRTFANAIAAFRTPESVRLLIQLGRTTTRADLRDAAKSQLAELFNTPELAYNGATLAAWLDARRAWSDDRWRDELASTQLDRLQRERIRAERAERLLEEFVRNTWVATPEPERETFLMDLLRSDVDALRTLGSELIREVLASGLAIPDGVQNEAIAMLAHARATVRAEAATLVVQIAPQSAGPAVLDALIGERDPRVAEPLLLAISRWPTPEALPPVLDWLERAGRTSIPAADAMLALHRADLLAQPQSIERVRSALRAMPTKHVSASACHLLVAVGAADDRAFVVSLLKADRHALRLAAAAALATRADQTETLLQAAIDDPLLIEPASRAVQTHMPTSAGVRRLDGFSQANPQAILRAQQAISRQLSIPDLLTLAQRFDADPCKRAEALLVLTERTLEDDAPPEARDALYQALAALAHARFDCGQPAQAIAAFSLIDPASLTADDRHIFCRARIRTADLAAAMTLAAPPAIWLEEHARLQTPDDAEKRIALASFIVENFAESIPADALDALQSELALANDDGPDLVQADPPSTDDPQNLDNPGQ